MQPSDKTHEFSADVQCMCPVPVAPFLFSINHAPVESGRVKILHLQEGRDDVQITPSFGCVKNIY